MAPHSKTENSDINYAKKNSESGFKIFSEYFKVWDSSTSLLNYSKKIKIRFFLQFTDETVVSSLCGETISIISTIKTYVQTKPFSEGC